MGTLRKGIVITVITKYMYVMVSFIITMILSRILSPGDFGIVAIVTVFTNLFLILGDMGIRPAIVQKKDLTSKNISEIFFLTIMGGIVFGFIFIGIAEIIAFIYDNSVYRSIGQLLAISVVFSVWNIVPQGLLQKEKKFMLIGLITVVSTFLSGTAAIISALNDFSYYSIVLQSILYSILIFLFNFYYSKLKFSIGFNLNTINKIKSYSSYQMLFDIINYFARNLDKFLIGKMLSEVALGYYNLAYKLVLMPVQYLTNAVTPVLHPVLSDYQNNYNIIYEQFLKVVRVLSVLGAFISIFCYIFAADIITVIYGPNWGESIEPFRILSLSIGFQMIMSASGSIFQASGNTKYLFFSGLFSAITIISGIIIGTIAGDIVIVASGITFAYIINFVQTFYILINVVLKQKIRDFFDVLKWPILAAFITMIVADYFRVEMKPLISVVLNLIITGTIYCLMLIATGEFKRFLKILIPRKSKNLEAS